MRATAQIRDWTNPWPCADHHEDGNLGCAGDSEHAGPQAYEATTTAWLALGPGLVAAASALWGNCDCWAGD